MHAWELAEREIDFDAHSALVAVGGDGTLHEVINGSLMREKRTGSKLPISFVPNGSGNDLVGCLGIKDINQALNWLVKAQTVKMDVNKVLLDYEHEDDITDTESVPQKFRYSVINTSVGFIAKITHKAVAHKPIMGRGCYTSAAIVNFFSNDVEDFGVVIEQADGSVIEFDREQTMFFCILNGRYGGGRIPLAPAALLNDGLFDVTM